MKNITITDEALATAKYVLGDDALRIFNENVEAYRTLGSTPFNEVTDEQAAQYREIGEALNRVLTSVTFLADGLLDLPLGYEPQEPEVPSLGFLSGNDLDPKVRAAAENAGILKGDEVFADPKYLTCTFACGGCVNGELCSAVVERALSRDASILAYGEHSVSTCGHDGECAALAGRA